MAEMTTVDALVVGGGAAGLGAALALCRQMHTVVVFDSGRGGSPSATSDKTHMVVATWHHRPQRDFLAAARAELLTHYGDQCSFVDTEVQSISRVPAQENERLGSSASSVFVAQEAVTQDAVTQNQRRHWRGRKIVLATGVRHLLPALDGIDDCWHRGGIVHCLFCHGHERRGAQSVAVMALDAFAQPSTLIRVVRSCRRFAKTVRIYTNGNTRVAAQLRDISTLVPGSEIDAGYIERLDMVGSSVEGEYNDIRITVEGESTGSVHAFAVYRPVTTQGSSLPKELGVDLGDDGDIRVGVLHETSVPGVFAAGDCASADKFVCVASTTGFMAGAGTAQQLQAEARY